VSQHTTSGKIVLHLLTCTVFGSMWDSSVLGVHAISHHWHNIACHEQALYLISIFITLHMQSGAEIAQSI